MFPPQLPPILSSHSTKSGLVNQLLPTAQAILPLNSWNEDKVVNQPIEVRDYSGMVNTGTTIISLQNLKDAMTKRKPLKKQKKQEELSMQKKHLMFQLYKVKLKVKVQKLELKEEI